MMLSFQSDLSPKFSYFLPSGDTSRIIYHTDSIGISNTITRYVVRHTVPDYGPSNLQLILWSLNQLKGSHSFLCTYLTCLTPFFTSCYHFMPWSIIKPSSGFMDTNKRLCWLVAFIKQRCTIFKLTMVLILNR